jgi:hypothetical protein
MREKIAHILCEDAIQGFKTSSKELADQIHKEYMAWFRTEIEKLKPLSDEELEAVYEKAYSEACEFSEEYESGLSSEHWMPTRQGDRKRYFNEQYREMIQEHTAQAQLAKDKEDLRKVME